MHGRARFWQGCRWFDVFVSEVCDHVRKDDRNEEFLDNQDLSVVICEALLSEIPAFG